MFKYLKNIFKKKIVILTGAGFTANPLCGCPGTSIITNSFRSNIQDPTSGNSLQIGTLPAGEYIYQRLCSFYSNNTRTANCSASEVNFETIIYFLEEIYSYFVSQNTNSFPEFRGIKPSYSDLIVQMINDIRTALPPFILRLPIHQNHSTEYIRFLFDFFIDLIIQQVNPFNGQANNGGMTLFRDNFIHTKLPDKKWIKRIYTTNYDTWINSFMGYYDGFNLSGEFEGENVMRKKYNNTHYNIHGCIQWRPDINTYKVTKLRHAHQMLNQGISYQFGLDREPLMATPIITGYNKLQRMKYNPYLELYYSLQKDILISDLLLIIGYGFNDIHLNHLLALFKKNIIIVTHFSPIPGSNPPEYDPFSDEVNEFMTKVIHSFNRDIIYDMNRTRDWISSDDNKIRIWWKGIGQEFYGNWDSISNF